MWETIKGYWVDFVDGLIWLVTALPLSLMEMIPVPDWLDGSTFALPDGVLWFTSAFEMSTGIAIMSSAYVTRFLIRRLPFIG